MPDVLQEDVGAFAVAPDREADLSMLGRRAERKEVETLLGKVHAADDQQAPVLYAVLHREHAVEERRIIVRLVQPARIEAAERRLVRKREIPCLDLLERRGVENQDLLGKRVEQPAIGGVAEQRK